MPKMVKVLMANVASIDLPYEQDVNECAKSKPLL